MSSRVKYGRLICVRVAYVLDLCVIMSTLAEENDRFALNGADRSFPGVAHRATGRSGSIPEATRASAIKRVGRRCILDDAAVFMLCFLVYGRTVGASWDKA